jgi:Spy/CpxP family protein refolding chaperone
MRILKISALLLACSLGALALAPAHAESDEKKGLEARIERVCARLGKSDKFNEMQAKRAERIGEALKLTDAQKAAFKSLQDARAKARADQKAAICDSTPDVSTFTKKLAFREAQMQRRLDAFKATTPKLVAFYNSLDEGQKTKFEDMMRHRMKKGDKKDEGSKGGESDEKDDN